MKLKKLIALVLSVVTAGSCFAAVGCNNNSKDDPLTVNLMMSGGGYGTGWIDEIIENFNEVYKEEGYKVKRLPVGASFGTASALAEMRLGTKSGYDIVFPGSVYAYDALDPVYGACVEPLDDLYASKAIGFDGKEEDKTLAEKLLVDDFSTWTGKDIYDVADGEMYGYFKIDAVRGLVCNTAVLANYAGVENFDEDYPRTTGELFDLFDKVATNGQEEGVMPVVYAGDDQAGAATYGASTAWLPAGQILGKEEYNKRWNMEEFFAENGNKYYSDDWKYTLESEHLLPTVEFVMQLWDDLYAINGADTMTLNVAEGNLMMGMAAFMHNGNYFYTEVRNHYSDYLDDVRMIADPIHSYVGMKHELCGVDHNVGYGNNSGVFCANCDKILSALCKGIDREIDLATLKSQVETELSVTLTEEQVAKVYEARTCGYGIAEPGYIIKDSPKKDIAKLFLRMLASEDASRVINKNGMMTVYSKSQTTADTPQFVKDCFELRNRESWAVDVHNRPDAKQVIGPIVPTYSATVGVQLHVDMDNNSHWSQRDYAKMAKNLFSKGGKAYNNVVNTYKTNVQNKGFIYDEGKNPRMNYVIAD